MTMNQIREGDILLVAVDKQPPQGVAPKKQIILAEGETTGHAHRLAASQVLEWEEDGQRYVRVIGTSPGSLSHEDHDPVPAPVVAPETTYRVVPQKETDMSGQWRKVVD